MVRFSVSLSNAIFSFITTLQQLNLGIKKDAYIYAPYVPRFSDAQRVSLFNKYKYKCMNKIFTQVFYCSRIKSYSIHQHKFHHHISMHVSLYHKSQNLNFYT